MRDRCRTRCAETHRAAGVPPHLASTLSKGCLFVFSFACSLFDIALPVDRLKAILRVTLFDIDALIEAARPVRGRCVCMCDVMRAMIDRIDAPQLAAVDDETARATSTLLVQIASNLENTL